MKVWKSGDGSILITKGENSVQLDRGELIDLLGQVSIVSRDGSRIPSFYVSESDAPELPTNVVPLVATAKKPPKRLPISKRVEVRRLRRQGETVNTLAKTFDVSVSTINNIIAGRWGG